jgi:outer membrane protein assembly factor BamB
MIFDGKTILVGTHDGAVHALDGATGAARAVLPAAKGAVVGIALAGGRVYSTSIGGELAATTRDGKLVFRSDLGAPAATPPTILDDRGAMIVAVGDAKGRVTAFDATTGKKKWSTWIGAEKDARSIGAGLAAYDGAIYAGSENGTLAELRAVDGAVSWSIAKGSPLRAAPILSDLDADKLPELVVGWADGDVAIIDRNGKEKWSTRVEKDDGDPTGLLASPTPLPGARIGSLVVPTARWGKEDSIVILRRHFRAYQSEQGRVVASPVLGTLEPGGEVEAVFGTQTGDVLSFDATGGVSFLYRLDGPVDAPAMIADLDADGERELVVATTAGKLYALALHATQPPVLGRARGDSMKNDGVLPAIDLAWHLPTN